MENPNTDQAGGRTQANDEVELKLTKPELAVLLKILDLTRLGYAHEGLWGYAFRSKSLEAFHTALEKVKEAVDIPA